LPGESIRKYSPLVENRPDPVVDTDVFTEKYLRGEMLGQSPYRRILKGFGTRTTADTRGEAYMVVAHLVF
jgi:hypothetical protein